MFCPYYSQTQQDAHHLPLLPSGTNLITSVFSFITHSALRYTGFGNCAAPLPTPHFLIAKNMEVKNTQKPLIKFETLHIDYAHFFDEVKESRPKSDTVFFMCIDAEWCVNPTNPDQNIVLSYQIATASKEGTNNIIIYIKQGRRLTLAEIVESGIRSIIAEDARYKQLRKSTIAVILISHNVTAEWSVLADRDESYITKRIALIRGQPITDGHAIELPIPSGKPVKVKIFDTMLLAPASHQSLKKLSTLLGDDDLLKGEVSQKYIERMDLYKEECPEEFEKYALQDTKITLMLFFLLQDALNTLVNDLATVPITKKFKLYRTLASAGVKSFTNNNEGFNEYRKTLKHKHEGAYQLVARSYLGGRNEGYFIGRTANYPETKNKIWLDIDFTGCYPTAMATCPKIDITKEPEYIPASYKIDDNIAATLAKERIPEDFINLAQNALSNSLADFDKVLVEIIPKKYAKKIRSRAVIHNNDLIDKWKRRWDQVQQENSGDVTERVSIPGFAKIRFKFPPDTQFPCLPVRHKTFGLLYVLEGETVATAAEILLALKAGAEIKALASVEFPVELDEKNAQPVRLFLNHLKTLNEKRNSYKPGKPDASEVMEKLVKEFTNSFYGKIAQGIKPKKVFKPATRERLALGESDVTEACTASLTTSLARAALSATLLGAERFNKGRPLPEQITVISATTDGLLIGVPTPENFTVIEDYYEPQLKLKEKAKSKLRKILKRFGCEGLLDEIDRFLPISLMRNSRAALTLKEDLTSNNKILEIKHITDEIISIKTRGQIGIVSTGHTLLLARCNLRAPLEEIIEDPEEYRRIFLKGGIDKETVEAEWIIKNLDEIENGRDEIQTYNKITIKKFTEIYKNKEKVDVTKKIKVNKINSDFDWKRKITWTDSTGVIDKAISPYTIPFSTKKEMLSHRYAMESIRNKGLVARPEKVIQGVAFKKASLNTRGGELVAATKLFLRGLVHGKIPVQEETGSYSLAAEKLNKVWELNSYTSSNPKKWTKNDLKYAQRKEWTPCCINPTRLTEKLIITLAIEFTADPTATIEAIFAAEEPQESTVLIEYVITAITNAHKMGIAPFRHLYEAGLLPTWETILENFSEQLTVEYITACARYPFTPGEQPPYQAKHLSKIFGELGIPKEYCMDCARSLAPPSIEPRTKTRNPQEKTCMKLFLQALSQHDLKNRDLKGSEIVRCLGRFGVTAYQYYEERKKTFTPNCLKNTQDNIKQISRMAKAIDHDPTPFIDALIEKL